MDMAQAWREYFENWPRELRRRGVIITSFNEQIQFVEFYTSPNILVIQRSAPDTVGARMVMVPFGGILGLKIADVLRSEDLNSLGFAGTQSA